MSDTYLKPLRREHLIQFLVSQWPIPVEQILLPVWHAEHWLLSLRGRHHRVVSLQWGLQILTSHRSLSRLLIPSCCAGLPSSWSGSEAIGTWSGSLGNHTHGSGLRPSAWSGSLSKGSLTLTKSGRSGGAAHSRLLIAGRQIPSVPSRSGSLHSWSSSRSVPLSGESRSFFQCLFNIGTSLMFVPIRGSTTLCMTLDGNIGCTGRV